MMHVHQIESLDLPELEPYRTMRRVVEHHRRGIFVAEGPKLVARLLESGWPLVSILTTADWLEKLRTDLEKRSGDIRIFVGEKKLLEQLTGYSMWHGLQAVGKIPRRPSLEEVLQTCRRPYLFAAVDGVCNAENLGVIVRNCVAFGVQALLAGETSGSPYLRRAVKSSMGAIFHLPVVETGNLARTLDTLRAGNIRCIAAHPHCEENRLSETNLAEDSCIVFGSEGEGICAQVLKACDKCVSIPMRSGMDSLNVGSASAVFFHETARQRGEGGK